MIKILTTSDDWHHFTSPIEEYIKRLSKTCDIITLKPSRAKTREKIIQEETEKICLNLEKFR